MPVLTQDLSFICKKGRQHLDMKKLTRHTGPTTTTIHNNIITPHKFMLIPCPHACGLLIKMLLVITVLSILSIIFQNSSLNVTKCLTSLTYNRNFTDWACSHSKGFCCQFFPIQETNSDASILLFFSTWTGLYFVIENEHPTHLTAFLFNMCISWKHHNLEIEYISLLSPWVP